MSQPTESVADLPFIIGERLAPSNHPFPDTLPFACDEDAELQLVIQRYREDVDGILDAVYRHGSQIGTAMDASGIGRSYADDFVAFVGGGEVPIAGLRLLEIGCGTGYLLSRLQQEGAVVQGVEPGWHGTVDLPVLAMPLAEAIERGIGRFQRVVHYDVLEHVAQPVDFLRIQRGLLEPGGSIILSVPDSTPAIEAGDIGMLVHEHWSYFTAASLQRTAAAAGLTVSRLQQANFGGAIYAELRPSASADPQSMPLPAPEPSGFADRASAFQGLFERNLERWRAAGTVGIFAPARALNVLYRAGVVADLRFFDDYPKLHGKYMAPFTIPIESREQLLADPVDTLLIMSRTFGPVLAGELRRLDLLAATTIVAVGDEQWTS